MPPEIVTYLVILCYERPYPKQNTVARPKLKKISLPKKFLDGYATGTTKSLQVLVRQKRTFPPPSRLAETF